VVAVLMAALVIASSLWSFQQTEEAAKVRNRTLLVLNRADDLLSAVKDAETGQRGYLLTGDTSFLEPYLAVRDKVNRQLEELSRLTSNEPSRRYLDAAAPLVAAKLDDLSKVIAVRRSQGLQATVALVSEGTGKRLMDAIRLEMKNFNQLQESVAQQHDQEFRANMRILFGIIVVACLAVLMSAFAFAYLMYRENQQRLKNLVYLETKHLLDIQRDTNRQLQQANATLQVSEEKLSVTLNSIGDAVIATDASGCVTLLNPLAEQLTGWTLAQASGQTIDQVFHIISQETRLPATIPVKATLALGTIQGLANHTVLIARDGSECPIADSCAPIRDRNALVVGAVLVFRDVTEEHAAQRALHEKNVELERATLAAKKANLAKSEFLSTMSHEIRTPMNGVIGMIDVLQQSSLNGPQLEMTGIIHDSAFALLAVINDILDFSKIEAKKLDIESIPMSVSDVVQGACENMNPTALKKGVQLTLFVDPQIPPVLLGDPGRLRQILINLCNNAVKFSAGQQCPGAVSVRATLAEKSDESVTLRFEVADNGIGIDMATQARLFTAFIQADASTTRHFGGTGLGLAISGQLAEIMGGSITVQSELGQGSVFCVRLPFMQSPAAAVPMDALNPVDGLACLVLAGPAHLADDLATYLGHSHASVERAADLAAARPWMVQHPGGVCIITDSASAAQLSVLMHDADQAGPHKDIHFLVIGRGQRRKARHGGERLVLVDENLLTQRAFLNAVAIAAGRAQAADLDYLTAQVVVTPVALSREAARRQGRLILVAEDNEYNQKVILQQLLLLGRTADMANNGQEALQRWKTGAYGILITDLHMPLMDGYELTAAIRAAEQGSLRMPIIAFTANALKGEAERCKAIGMDDYLSKPVQLVQLKAMLKKWQPVVLSEPTTATARMALAAPSQQPVPVPMAVDVRVLAALIGDDSALVREFLNDFEVSARQIAAALRSALTAGDTQAAGASAHQLKSSARSVGAAALGELCAAMEAAGKGNQSAMLAELLPQFELEFARVTDFLDAF
jgi:PAS domain S-box-containing protein